MYILLANCMKRIKKFNKINRIPGIQMHGFTINIIHKSAGWLVRGASQQS